ncbi:DUF3422 domain-containing protein [Pseudohalioglobus sediminis]|uniref:DUF3422 domain-containing protein n=1 Tax=Pseudohalioglobus sediminis TaxID=2606449 RepID=A0A5B0WTJ0_9GAMM|nr:DUF3422 domain-containing protein [Pseudohalioglobus sediminis]KAA1189615.1 DUF3422 domain-containing protein [Pseudohalioglobus sediminis]
MCDFLSPHAISFGEGDCQYLMEDFSIFAISYYAIGLIGYARHAAHGGQG